jgi:glycosyltransferase involved in cell wall biosynthesis
MVRQLAGNLVRSGLEIHVATTDDDGAQKLAVPCGKPLVQDGVTYWHFPRQFRFYTFSWPLNVWLSKHVAEFDLIHIHALFSYPALSASYWATVHGIPYVVRPLGTLNEWGMKNRRPWLKKASFRFLEHRILKRAALIHYTSDRERAEAEILGVGRPSVVIPNALPNGSSDEFSGTFRGCYQQLRDRRIILFLSRLDQKKGLDLLLESFANVRQEVSDAALVIAGEGDRRFAQHLKSETLRLGIAQDVLWTGFLTGDQKRAAFADALMFVLPSYSENFGIAVGEAMAAGLPVVVSNQVGIHGDISHAGAGLVVGCAAPELTRAMLRLLNDAELRATLGENGRRLVASKYSQEAVTGEVLDVYNRIAS